MNKKLNKNMNKAITYITSKKYKPALNILQKINLDKKQQTFQSIHLEGACCLMLKHYDKAELLFKKALILTSDNNLKAEVLNHLARIMNIKGNIEKHIEYIQQCISLLPKKSSLKLRLTLAQSYIQVQNYQDATKELKALLVYQEFTVKAIYELLNIALSLSDYKKTIFYLKQLEANFARLDEQQILTMITHLHRQRDVDLTTLIQKARDKGADEQLIQTIEARILIRQGKYKQALDYLNTIPLNKSSVIAQVYIHDLKGHMLDKLGRPDEAFIELEKMNRLIAKRLPPNWRQYDNLATNAQVGELTQRQVNYNMPIKVAFLVGFPRSGTTLLENVIDSQNSILTLGERPTIDRVIAKIRIDGYKYPEDLNDLSDEYVNVLRDTYFNAASDFLLEQSFSDYEVLLDKNPLMMIQLPLILTLFPKAKIILALRHPLDCILSCFMQNFRPTYHLGYFTEWKSSFTRYKEMFDLYQQYSECMNWNEYQIKYEDLISNFEVQVESILQFLDIKPDKEAYLGFNTHAKEKVITTPSRHEVRRGIYQDAKYRWESYTQYITPHWHTVKSYIEAFDYSAKSLEQVQNEIKPKTKDKMTP
jgi:tetratricopeptide (TPR) repeat protein